MKHFHPEQIFQFKPLCRFLNWVVICGLGVFSLPFFAALLKLLIDVVLSFFLFGFSKPGPFFLAGLCAGALAACLFGIRGRIRSNRRLRRMEQLASYLSLHRGQCSFRELAALWRLPLKDGLMPELYDMQKRGLLQNVVIDTHEEMLHFSCEVSCPKTAPDTCENLNEAEREAAPALARLRCLHAQLSTEEDTALLQRFSEDIEAVLADTRKDTRDVSNAVRFLHRFLPMGEKLAARLPGLSADRAQLRCQITEALDNLHTAFGNKLSLLYENDRVDAEAEAAVLEQLLRNNGLIDNQENQLFPPH